MVQQQRDTLKAEEVVLQAVGLDPKGSPPQAFEIPRDLPAYQNAHCFLCKGTVACLSVSRGRQDESASSSLAHYMLWASMKGGRYLHRPSMTPIIVPWMLGIMPRGWASRGIGSMSPHPRWGRQGSLEVG